VNKKEIFAHPTNFLIDDMPDFCEAWIDSGGFALHWHEEKPAYMLREIPIIREAMANYVIEMERAILENRKNRRLENNEVPF
jgi:hypothetical protein